MKSPYVTELQPNQIITTTLLVHIKDIRQKKSGEPYLSLLLGDRTGELDAKMWDNVVEVLDTFERDDFIRVKGLVQIYQNRPQLTIHKMTKVREAEVDFTDYFPSSQRSSDEMFLELEQIVAEMRDPHLRRLLEVFLADEELMRSYRIAPAAKNVHHAFLGGLLEHALSLCRLARMTAAHYPYVDLDLVLAGAMLHDIGKIAELTYDRSFGYSTEGQLLGHIVIGLRMLHEKITTIPDFPPRLRTLLEHLIVSHHGELEYGSPKIPLFPEALLLHHLDNLDSKMECMRALIARDRLAEGCWTSYSHSLDRSVLKKTRFLEDGQGATVAPAQEAEESPTPAVLKPATPEPEAPPVVPVQPAASPAAAAPPQRPEPAAPVVNRPAPPPQRREQPTSAFAEKLLQAWQK